MNCTCGAAAVGGGHSNWCDSTIEIPQLELARMDDDGQAFFFNSFAPPTFSPSYGSTAPPPTSPLKQYTLRWHNASNPPRNLEEQLLQNVSSMPFMEFEVDAWKKKFPFSSCIVNGKEHVNFITLTFEEC
jgi:hypothetical protein